MKKVTVENIENGMVLARDVAATSGNVLLGKGTTLSGAMGRRLKNWGIFTVYIEGEEESQEQVEADGASPEDIKQQLEAKFSLVQNNVIMKKVFDAVFQFQAGKND